jgi:hypothetical protein
MQTRNAMPWKALFLVLGLLAGLVAVAFGVAFAFTSPYRLIIYPHPKLAFWEFRSIDTMKFSRDRAREAINNPSFDRVIESQVAGIAATGATHIGIATPYDTEFAPVLRRWVASARKHGLKVWFRGNWAGWEGWFEYGPISRAAHLKDTQSFVLRNADLFENGDIFSSCPECENGGPGDPRLNGDIAGHRKFLIDEYTIVEEAFRRIGKHVRTNYFSMNGDVARSVMDKATTRALGGVVAIDHYVRTPEKLAEDVRDIARQSGGRIALGEFGAPIPDIHGNMTGEEQAKWIEKTLTLLAEVPEFIGLNYWTAAGGSTALWTDDGRASEAVRTITDFYKPRVVYGTVQDEIGRPVVGARVANGFVETETDWRGYFELIDRDRDSFELNVVAGGFIAQTFPAAPSNIQLDVVLKPEQETLFFGFLKFMKQFVYPGEAQGE